MREVMVSGLFPRSNELIREIKKYELGKMSKEELRAKLNDERTQFLEHQKMLKIHIISEPHYNFHDLMRPLTAMLKNVEAGTLTRYFETNTFYRKPVIAGKIAVEDMDPANVKEYNLPGPYYFKNTKIALPSPNYFFLLSSVTYDRESFYKDYIDIMNQIIMDSGASYVEMVECPYPSDFKDYENLLKSIKHPEKIIVRKAQAYLNPDRTMYHDMKFYSYPNKASYPLFQSIDTMNTKLENLDSIPEAGIITGNENFDFLPREIAMKKLDLMAKLEVR